MPLAESGIRCSVVDFEKETVPGIHRLGSTMDDLGETQLFDVVICNHVLEHVAHPVTFLETIAKRLEPDGLVYVEVPIEVWRGIPISKDPVTHVNFFTLQSLTGTLRRAGLEPVEASAILAPYGERYKRVAYAVCRAGVRNAASGQRSADESFACLSPNLPRRVARAACDLWLHGVLNFPLRVRQLSAVFENKNS